MVVFDAIDQDFCFSSYSCLSFSDRARADNLQSCASAGAPGAPKGSNFSSDMALTRQSLAHADDVEALFILEHPVLAFELGDHALDRTLDAERLAAADAGVRLFLLDDAAHGGRGAEIDLRFERDHLFRAGRNAQVRTARRRPRRNAVSAFPDRPTARRSGRQVRRLGIACSRRRSRRWCRKARLAAERSRRPGEAPPPCSSRKASRTTSRLRPTAEKVAGLAAPSIGAMSRQRSTERIRIVGFDGCDTHAGKPEPGQDRLRQRDGLRQARGVVARLAAREKTHRRSTVSK